jgi:hypothetical protein
MNRSKYGIVVVAVALLAGSNGRLVAAKSTVAPKVVAVDCSKGQSVEAWIKDGTDPIEIVVSGFCAEAIVIARGGVIVRGASGDPQVDGFTGLEPDGTSVDLGGALALVTVEGVERGAATASASPSALPVHLRDLGIRDSPGMGLIAVESAVGLTNVRVEHNATVGVTFTSTSFGIFDRLTAADNGGIGVRANREALINCGSCQFDGNGSWAAVGSNGGKVALYDAGTGGGPSVASGPRGVQTFYGGRAWLYPGTEIVATSGLALWAVQGGAIESLGAAVDGAVWCGLDGELYVNDLEQRSNNGVNNFYTECAAHFEGGQVTLVGTTQFLAHASGALFHDGSASFDDLQCFAGGDFVCFGPVTATTRSGCDCS